MNYQIFDDDVSIDVIFLLFFFSSNSCNRLLFIVSMFFFFSFFVIIFSIISDFEISFLSVFAENTIQKIFRAENVIEANIAFAAIVFDFSQIISSNEIAISNRNAKKKIKMNKFLLQKKVRMTSSDNILMLFRRRCRLTFRN